tara:strand:+ start:5765 stop:6034 length:270 start_codon:yes stop_codon:yes gene_type:complete
MPRYLYACTECDVTGSFFHSLNESIEDCAACEASGSMQKMLSTPTFQRNRQSSAPELKVGTLTQEYIEINREILKEERQQKMEFNDEST